MSKVSKHGPGLMASVSAGSLERPLPGQGEAGWPYRVSSPWLHLMLALGMLHALCCIDLVVNVVVMMYKAKQ